MASLAKLMANIASWCARMELPVTQENIGKYLATGRSISRYEYECIMQAMVSKYWTPVTIRVKKSPDYWVPAASDERCLVARVPFMGSFAGKAIYDAMPNAIDEHLIRQHEEWKLKQKEKELACMQVVPNAGKRKKIILLAY